MSDETLLIEERLNYKEPPKNAFEKLLVYIVYALEL